MRQVTQSVPGPKAPLSNLRIEIEKGVQAAFELGLDLFARPLDHVHGDMRFVAVGQLKGCVLDFSNFAFRKEPESVNKGQVGHNRHHKDKSDTLEAVPQFECPL